jgi:hypothetical protein
MRTANGVVRFLLNAARGVIALDGRAARAASMPMKP